MTIPSKPLDPPAAEVAPDGGAVFQAVGGALAPGGEFTARALVEKR